MIRSVIFDIDNTLYDYGAAHRPAYAAMTDFACRALSCSADEVDALHRWANDALTRRVGSISAAIHNRLIRSQLMLERAGAPVALAPGMADAYWSVFLENLHPFPGAAETLARLKAMGLRVGIGTNMCADRQYDKLARLGFIHWVDFIVTSEEAGVEKPDAKLFGLCAMKAGCPACECAFVGDDIRKDIEGALNAGMRAVWLSRDEAAPPEGARVIRALGELPALLADL